MFYDKFLYEQMDDENSSDVEEYSFDDALADIEVEYEFDDEDDEISVENDEEDQETLDDELSNKISVKELVFQLMEKI